jgi:hypothetical protein
MDLDNKDKPRMAVRSAPSGDTEILRVDGDKFTQVYSCGVFETCDVIRFNKDDKRVYMESNKGARDLSQLVLFDPETGKEEFVEEDSNKRVDFGGAIFSERTDELIGHATRTTSRVSFGRTRNLKRTTTG